MSAYISPSSCELCVPIESVTTLSSLTWHTELAHERDCQNHPTQKTEK
jgi:hypothetical protein